jgi:hypothetical protein
MIFNFNGGTGVLLLARKAFGKPDYKEQIS